MGKVSGPDSDSKQPILKLILLVFNAFSFIFGLILFSLSLWIRYDKEIKEYVEHSNIYMLWTGAYILCAVGAFLMIFSMFAICGVFLESRVLLLVYSVLLVLLFLLEMIGVGITLSYATRSGSLEALLADRINRMIVLYDVDPANAATLDLIQSKLRCCGNTGGADYDKYNKPIPSSCQDRETGNQFRRGCVTTLSQWLDSKSSAVAGVTLTVLFAQVFGFLATVFLIRKLALSEKKGLLYDPVRNQKA